MKQPYVESDSLGVQKNAPDRTYSENAEIRSNENIKTVYEQLCQSYRAIDDFRSKLLGFLPLASGTGIFFLIRETGKPFEASLLFPVGVFGFVITLGLFVFEICGIRK